MAAVVLALLLSATTPAGGGGAAPLPWLVSTADSMTNVQRTFAWFEAGASAHSPAVGAFVEMAANEVEGVQVVVTAPGNRPALNVTWVDRKGRLLGPRGLFQLKHNRTGAAFPAQDISAAPYGYVHQGPCPFPTDDPSCPATRPYHCKYNNDSGGGKDNLPPGPCASDPDHCTGCAYRGSPYAGAYGSGIPAAGKPFDSPELWWPYPLMDWVTSVDVAAGTSQPVLLSFRTRPDTPPGNYTGELLLTDGAQEVPVAVCVIVRNFSLPVGQSLSTFWGASDERPLGIYGQNWTRCVADPSNPHTRGCDPELVIPDAEDGATQFAQLMNDHRMGTAGTIYAGGLWSPFATVASLKKLWDSGQRTLMLGGLSDCDHCETGAPAGCSQAACKMCDAPHSLSCNMDCMGSKIATMASDSKMATAAGFPPSQQYVYLMDESSICNVYACARTMAMAVKQAMPGVKVVIDGDVPWSLAVDNTSAVFGPGGALELVDMLVCHPAVFADSADAIAAGRKHGKEFGFYSKTASVSAPSFSR